MKYKIFFLIFVLINNFLLSIIIPSNGLTNVSRQTQPQFFATDSNNTMLGFGAFEAGFILNDSLTTCTFNSYFPISGNVDMRGGRLFLAVDLEFDESISFISTGTITGNSFSLLMPANNGTVFVPTGTAGNFNFIAKINENNVVNSIDWSPDSLNIAVATNLPLLSTNNLAIVSFNGSVLTQLANVTLGASATCVRWHPALNYVLVAIATSTNIRQVYQYTTGALTAKGSTTADLGTVGSAIAWSPNGLYFAGGDSGDAASFYLNVSSFNTSTGAVTYITQVAGTPVSQNALSWDPSAGGNALFVAGSGTSPQLGVYTFDGTNLVQASTNVVGNTVTAVAFAPTGGYLAVGISGGTDNLRIYQRSGTTLTDIPSSHVGETNNVLSIDWSPDGSTIVVGYAVNSNTELRTYSFNQSTNTLTLIASLGTTFNNNTVSWSPNGKYIAVGDSGDFVTIYGIPMAASLVPLVCENLKMILNANVVFYSPVLFNGVCEIEGNGYSIDLSNINNFNVGRGASLLLKNINILGVSGSVVSTLDNTGVLNLRNARWIQNGNSSFNQGSFNIIDSMIITGTGAFTYSSSQASTVQSNATLTFDSGMTFSYAPSSSSQTLIQMTDSTSQLYLLNSSLNTNSTGLQLTKGTLVIEGYCSIVNPAVTQSQGVIFGDGTSAANNLTVKILPGSGFNINSGYLVHNNI